MDGIISIAATLVAILYGQTEVQTLKPEGVWCLAYKTVTVISEVQTRMGAATIYVPVDVCDLWVVIETETGEPS